MLNCYIPDVFNVQVPFSLSCECVSSHAKLKKIHRVLSQLKEFCTGFMQFQ